MCKVLKRIGNGIIRFLKDESGMGTVEIILIMVVLIGLVIVFKQQVDGLVQTIFGAVKEKAGFVTG